MNNNNDVLVAHKVDEEVYKTIYEIEEEDKLNGKRREYINPKTNEPYEMVAGLCVGKMYYSEKLGRGITLSRIDEEKGYVFTKFMLHIKMFTWACKIETFKKQFSPMKPNCFKGNCVTGFVGVDNYEMKKLYPERGFNKFFKTPEEYEQDRIRHEQYEKDVQKEREERAEKERIKKMMKENGTWIEPEKKPRHHNRRNNGKDTLKSKIKRHERVMNKKGSF